MWRSARQYVLVSAVVLSLLVVLTAVPSGSPAGAATDQRLNPPPFLSNSLTPTAPDYTTFAGEPVVTIGYTNNLNISETFVVYGVFHNPLGQVVFMTSGTVTLLVGGNATAYLVTSLLPLGSYRATIFATTTTGVVVSPVSTLELEVA